MASSPLPGVVPKHSMAVLPGKETAVQRSTALLASVSLGPSREGHPLLLQPCHLPLQ